MFIPVNSVQIDQSRDSPNQKVTADFTFESKVLMLLDALPVKTAESPTLEPLIA